MSQFWVAKSRRACASGKERGPSLEEALVGGGGTVVSEADFSMLGVGRVGGRSMVRGVKLCFSMR